MAKRGSSIDRYVCVPLRTWDDLRALGLAPAPSPATLFMWLAAGPLSSRVPGVVTGGPLAIAEAIGWAPDVCTEQLASLESAGVTHVDRVARIVYLPQLLAAECSRPSSPSTAAMWARELRGLVPCALRERIIADARTIIATLGAAQLDSFETGRDPQAGKPRSNRNLAGNLTGSLAGNHRARDLSPALSLSPSQAPSQEQGAGFAGVPPYSLKQMQADLSESSGGRFVVVPLRGKPLVTGNQMAAEYTHEQVRLAGAWLKAGGDAYKATLDGRDLRDLPSWIANAEKWDTDERPTIGKPKRINPGSGKHGIGEVKLGKDGT
jgi:hypothetical protein